MQISASHYYPIATSAHSQSRPRQATPSQRPLETVEYPATGVSQYNVGRAERRSPLYVQPTQQGNLSRTSEQALRAYRTTALAGEPGELVNRLYVTA